MSKMIARIAASLLFLLAVGQASFAVPVATVGRSDDPWEGRPEANPRKQTKCIWLDAPYLMAVPAQNRSAAVSRLIDTPVVLLGDQEAASLLGIPLSPATSVSAAFFSVQFERMDTQRKNAYERHAGSWSKADQNVLDELQAVRFGPRLQHFRPYLVRALAETKLGGSFIVRVCGNAVLIDHQSVGIMYLPPERSAVVLFLETAPDTVFVEWSVVDSTKSYP